MAKKLENKSGMPVNLIIDELKSDDIRKRINAVKNLNLIASTIGVEKARNELIPFISELLDDEDEVLLELVESLSGNFIDYIGGQQYLTLLLPILEVLCKSEESTIREKACNFLKKILCTSNADLKKQEELIMGLLRRLNDNDYYMAKSSLSFLIPAVLMTVSSQAQNELIIIYSKLIIDPVPSVKKYASMNFKDMVKRYPLVTEGIITQTLSTFLKDDQDFVRMYVVDSTIQLGKTSLNQKNSTICQNFLKQLAEDHSWRVKYYFCSKLSEITFTIGKEFYKKSLINYHYNFIQDAEPEMKSIAILRVSELIDLMEVDDILNRLIPLFKTLQFDQNNFVRTALASSVLTLCPLIGKKSTSEQVLSIFLALLKDSDSDVRITLFKKMSFITKVLGVETLSQSVVPALTELAQEKNWRIRAQTIEVLGFFARAIGQEFFNEKIIKLLFDWLNDRVFAVRETAVQTVRQLVEILGASWAEKNLLQKIMNLSTNTNYLHRLTMLFIINQLAPLLINDTFQKNILPLMQQMSKDPVPNVRLNFCKTIKVTSQYFKDKEVFKKIFLPLLEDPDNDVKYYAKLTMKSL